MDEIILGVRMGTVNISEEGDEVSKSCTRALLARDLAETTSNTSRWWRPRCDLGSPIQKREAVKQERTTRTLMSKMPMGSTFVQSLADRHMLRRRK